MCPVNPGSCDNRSCRQSHWDVSLASFLVRSVSTMFVAREQLVHISIIAISCGFVNKIRLQKFPLKFRFNSTIRAILIARTFNARYDIYLKLFAVTLSRTNEWQIRYRFYVNSIDDVTESKKKHGNATTK